MAEWNAPHNAVEEFNRTDLIDVIDEAVKAAKTKIENIRDQSDEISIADMFDMQMLMNHLSQLTEMSGSVVNASNQAIMSLARNVKG